MGTVERAFDTHGEAEAFEYGVEYANDSAITPQGIDEREIKGRTVFVVVMIDDDAEDDDLWPDDKLP